MTEVKDFKVTDKDVPDPICFVTKNDISIPFIRDDAKFNVYYETKHDRPCPRGLGEDVSKDKEVNEWVLNHLPLKEDEKKALLHQLKLDQLKNDRKEEVEGLKEDTLKAKKSKKKMSREVGREGVKEKHNSKNQDDSIRSMESNV